MILIVGASGTLGRATARLLLDSGSAVRAMSRNPDSLKDLAASGAEVIEGDLRTPASLVRACEGVRGVLAAAHAFDGRGTNTSRNVDDAGNRALIDAAAIAGVSRFVFVSTLDARPDHPVDFFRTKYAIEQYVRASGLEWVVLRAAAFMEVWAELIVGQVRSKGTAPIFGNGTNPINFVSAGDVARFAVLALEKPELRHRVIEVGGPQNHSLLDVLDTCVRVSGKPGKAKHIPLPVMRTFATLLRYVDPVRARMMSAGAAMATQDLTFDMSSTLREYPLTLTRLEDYVRTRSGEARH